MTSGMLHPEFQKELTKLLNKHCIDSHCETPDFILAGYLTEQVETYSKAVKWTAQWKEPRATMELE